MAGTARLVADAPGMNSTRVSSAGMNTGASAIVLSDRDVVPTIVPTVAKCIGIGLSLLQDCKLILTGSPDEYWSGSDLETK